MSAARLREIIRGATARDRRRVGYHHGYHGRPAVTTDAHYQQGWREGRQAAERSKA